MTTKVGFLAAGLLLANASNALADMHYVDVTGTNATPPTPIVQPRVARRTRNLGLKAAFPLGLGGRILGEMRRSLTAATTENEIIKMKNIALALALPAVVQAQDYTYTTNNGGITITGYTGPGGDVTIPDTINAYPVTSIRMGHSIINS